MHKIKSSTLTAKMAKSSFKGKIERLFARYNALSFVSSVKGAPAYRKQFLYAALAMVKKLGITTYFLTMLCADLR